VTCPCASPWRVSAPSPRAPSASDRASSRIDFPAPVSPVRMVRPSANSRSNWSISTMSRIESRASMGFGLDASGRNDGVIELGNPGLLVFLRRQAAILQQIVGVLVPLAIGEVVAEHGGGGLRFVGDAE